MTRRKSQMSQAMKSYVAYARLVAKDHKNGTSHVSFEHMLKLRDRAYAEKARQDANDAEKKLWEQDLKALGFEAAIEAAKARKEAEK